MAHMDDVLGARAERWTNRLIGLVVGGFIMGAVIVAAFFPNPQDGPTPGVTKLALYGLFAALAVCLGFVPLVVGWAVERRSGRRPALAWRAALAGGVAVAVATLGLGVWTWAYPPHNLRECFPAWKGNGTPGTRFTVCEDGRVNRQLGVDRLNQGIGAGAIVLIVTVVAVTRMRSRAQTL
jgi:hypothetical protein